MYPSASSPSHSSSSPMQNPPSHHHHQRLPSHLFHEYPSTHFRQDSGPPPSSTGNHPSNPHHVEMHSQMSSHTGQQEMYSTSHPPSHEGNHPPYPVPENGETRFSSPYQHQTPLHQQQQHAPQFVQHYHPGPPPPSEHRTRQGSFPIPMLGSMPVQSSSSQMQMLSPHQHVIPVFAPEGGHYRVPTGESFSTQHGNLPMFQAPNHLIHPSPHHALSSPQTGPNYQVMNPPYTGIVATQLPQLHHNNTPPSFNHSRPYPSQHIPHPSNRNNASSDGTNPPPNPRYVRTLSHPSKQGLNNVNGSPRKPHHQQHQEQGHQGQQQHHQRNFSHPHQSHQPQKQQQQKTPKQKRVYNTQGQYPQQYNHNPITSENSSSPFRYNYNRRSSVLSDTSGNSTLNHSTPQTTKRFSSYYKSNLPTTKSDENTSNAYNGTFVEEEEVWNGDHYPALGQEQQGGIVDLSSVTTWNTSDTMLYPYPVSGGVEQSPYPIYQPCMNQSCPNIYHYTQQLYQPISESHNTGLMNFVDIPGMIPAPAWCELSPCGCTICRDCFTSIVSQRETLPSSDTTGQEINEGAMMKRFKCLICSMKCKEFGPINEALQNVVEAGKALIDTSHQESGNTQTHSDISGSYDMGDKPPYSKQSEFQEDIQKLKISNAIIPIPTNFDDFQSAQDIASGKSKAPISTSSIENSSNTISPLLQPILAGNRYAKSDPPPSIPHSPFALALPVSGKKHHNTAAEVEVEGKTSECITSIDFPSLLQDRVQITLPSRKISTTSTNTTTSTTNTYESPIPESTPDLGTWSSSSASINSMPSSPETLHSPTIALRSVNVKGSHTPWTKKTTLPYYEEKVQVGTVDKALFKESRDSEIGKQSEKGFSTPGRNDQIQSQAIGLGFKFDNAQFPTSRTTSDNAPNDMRGIQNHGQTSEDQSISQTAARDKLATPAKKWKSKGKSKNVSSPSNESISTPTPQKPHTIIEDTSSSQNAWLPQRTCRSEGQMTPSRPSRGHNKARGGGAYIAAHQARMAEISQHPQTPNKPARNDSFGSTRNRTDTHSSIHTSHSSSSHSTGSWIFHPNGRKVSMAENKTMKLPELLANPTPEQISTWEYNKNKWWIDPWLGQRMGIQERLIGRENILFRSDGSRLVDGRAAGISWPILKVHNIAFTTTITDIESFVPDCTLAPLTYNAQAVHLLCDLADGKTRPYAYVECISIEAAEKVIRESDGRYLTGRQAGFRPVTQKELALDLFPRLRKYSYWNETIIKDLTNRHEHQRQYSGPFVSPENPSILDLFNERDYQQLKRLFDKTLPSPNDGKVQDVEDSDRDNYFFFPPERPFAALISMIVKYPYHAISETDKSTEHYNQEIDRLMGCVLYAMEKLAPNIENQPALRKVWDRLHASVMMCPAFDGPRRDILTSAWERFSQVLHTENYARAA